MNERKAKSVKHSIHTHNWQLITNNDVALNTLKYE
jgi:hypothetical protein